MTLPSGAAGPAAGGSPDTTGDALAQGLAQHPDDAWVLVRAVRDVTGRIVDFRHEWANGTAERNAGRPLLGRTLLEVYRPQDASLIGVQAELVERGGHRQLEVGFGDDAADAQLRGRVFAVFFAAVGDDQLLCQYRDVTELRRAQRLLEHQAGHDELTGLPNRRLLWEHLHHALARLERADSALAVILCDLDGFKQVNDTHGHPAGDHVLRALTRRLAAALRPQDLLGRYGGDEFLVLCEDLPPGEADALAQRVRAAATGTYPLPTGVEVALGLSLGHVTATRPCPVDDLFAAADRALYADKTARRPQ